MNKLAVAIPAILVLASVSLAEQKEPKAVRLEHLQTALANQDRAIDLLSFDKMNASRKHPKELDAAKRARDAILRLINNVENRDENAGLDKEHRRDKEAVKSDLVVDYPTALRETRQLFDQNYAILSEDQGKTNVHRNNALKFLEEARQPIIHEWEEWERTHPAPPPAPPGTPAPIPAPGSPADLEDIVGHMDHAIDDVMAQPASDPLRQPLLNAIIDARDSAHRLLDEIQNRDPAGDIAADHTRDTTPHAERVPDYYHSLIQVQEYMHNDHIRLSRQPDDPRHHRDQSLRAMDQASSLVQQQIDAYRRAHPDAR